MKYDQVKTGISDISGISGKPEISEIPEIPEKSTSSGMCRKLKENPKKNLKSFCHPPSRPESCARQKWSKTTILWKRRFYYMFTKGRCFGPKYDQVKTGISDISGISGKPEIPEIPKKLTWLKKCRKRKTSS